MGFVVRVQRQLSAAFGYLKQLSMFPVGLLGCLQLRGRPQPRGIKQMQLGFSDVWIWEGGSFLFNRSHACT